jgi:predicted DNA-binding transcriptional regulator AlpA
LLGGKQVTVTEINPLFTYRYTDKNARAIFGYSLAACRQKIEKREIPAPVSLSDSGYFRAWLGRQIIEWQNERLAAPVRKRPGKQGTPPPRPKGPLDISKRRKRAK